MTAGVAADKISRLRASERACAARQTAMATDGLRSSDGGNTAPGRAGSGPPAGLVQVPAQTSPAPQ